MAEYIDRTELEPDTEWSEYEDGFVSYSRSQIQGMPKADVIERSKIDKAIEEIEKIDLIVHDGINHYYKDGEEVIAEVLEILKRNIGE